MAATDLTLLALAGIGLHHGKVRLLKKKKKKTTDIAIVFILIVWKLVLVDLEYLLLLLFFTSLFTCNRNLGLLPVRGTRGLQKELMF